MGRFPVETIVHFDMKGKATPLRVRFADAQEELQAIRNIKVVNRDAKKVLPSMNNPASIEFSYKCEAQIGDMKNPFTLTYNNQSCRWNMFI